MGIFDIEENINKIPIKNVFVIGKTFNTTIHEFYTINDQFDMTCHSGVIFIDHGDEKLSLGFLIETVMTDHNSPKIQYTKNASACKQIINKFIDDFDSINIRYTKVSDILEDLNTKLIDISHNLDLNVDIHNTDQFIRFDNSINQIFQDIYSGYMIRNCCDAPGFEHSPDKIGYAQFYFRFDEGESYQWFLPLIYIG